jgi:hypothetical protein
MYTTGATKFIEYVGEKTTYAGMRTAFPDISTQVVSILRGLPHEPFISNDIRHKVCTPSTLNVTTNS